MGYEPRNLRPCSIRQLEGSCDGYEALTPCAASVVAVEGIEFELRPFFMATEEALWGRRDFLAVFGFLLDHRAETFDLFYDVLVGPDGRGPDRRQLT